MSSLKMTASCRRVLARRLFHFTLCHHKRPLAGLIAPRWPCNSLSQPSQCPNALQALIIEDLKTVIDPDADPPVYARRRVQKGSVVVVRGSDGDGDDEATWVALVNKASKFVGAGGKRGCRGQEAAWVVLVDEVSGSRERVGVSMRATAAAAHTAPCLR